MAASRNRHRRPRSSCSFSSVQTRVFRAIAGKTRSPEVYQGVVVTDPPIVWVGVLSSPEFYQESQ